MTVAPPRRALSEAPAVLQPTLTQSSTDRVRVEEPDDPAALSDSAPVVEASGSSGHLTLAEDDDENSQGDQMDIDPTMPAPNTDMESSDDEDESGESDEDDDINQSEKQIINEDNADQSEQQVISEDGEWTSHTQYIADLASWSRYPPNFQS